MTPERITVSVSNSYYIIPDKSGQAVASLRLLHSFIKRIQKAPLNWWRNKCDYLASRRIGSRGGYMDLTTSSTLWGDSEGGALVRVRIAFMLWQSEHCVLPRADAFGHSDDVTEARWCLDLCPWTHCHGNQLFSQSVADLHVEAYRVCQSLN